MRLGLHIKFLVLLYISDYVFMASGITARTDGLRRLAANVGFTLRQSQRAFSDNDQVRFLGPLREVLSDIGGVLDCYAAEAGSRLLAARAEVRQELPLLAALASPAPSTAWPGATSGSTPPPEPPCK